MKRPIIRSVILVVAVLLAGGVWAEAQMSSVNINFPFVVGTKTMEAGSYTVDFGPNGVVVLTPAKGGAAVEIPRIRTLGGRSVRKVELVFDVVGSMRFLSEVWLPEKGGCEVDKHGDALERQTVSGPKVK